MKASISRADSRAATHGAQGVGFLDLRAGITVRICSCRDLDNHPSLWHDMWAMDHSSTSTGVRDRFIGGASPRAGVAQSVERRPEESRVLGSIPGSCPSELRPKRDPVRTAREQSVAGVVQMEE